MKPLNVSSLFKTLDLSSAMPALWLLSNIFPPNEPLFLFLCSVGARIKVQNITECNFLYATPDFSLWRQDLTTDLPEPVETKYCQKQVADQEALGSSNTVGGWFCGMREGGSKGARWRGARGGVCSVPTNRQQPLWLSPIGASPKTFLIFYQSTMISFKTFWNLNILTICGYQLCPNESDAHPSERIVYTSKSPKSKKGFSDVHQKSK